MPRAQQFICKNCKALSNVQTFEQTRDGAFYCRCDNCGAKNKVVHTGASPSQPGLLPVIGVIQ
jgi:RNase P subunit RPR2